MKKSIILSVLISSFILFQSCKEKPLPPVISTTSVTDITATTAVSGGIISEDGGAQIVSIGVCWNTSDNPTIENSKTSESVVSESFNSTLSQLSPNKSYYVRAYATNRGGTGYGESLTFKTLGDKPLSDGLNASNILVNSATLNGSVNPNLVSTSVTFEWGISTSYGNAISAKQGPIIGSTSISVSADLSGLTAGTTYHFRVKSTNEVGTTNSDDLTFTTYAVADVDNNLYSSVTIGTQIWMNKNLQTTHYSNGSDIPLVTDNTAWKNLSTPAYCWYGNDEINNKNIYGALYNWYTVNTGELCPTGWHVPSGQDLQTLCDFTGARSIAAFKLKEIGTTHWKSPNYSTDEYGFTALPAGERDPSTGLFWSLGSQTFFWSSSPASSTDAHFGNMTYNQSELFDASGSKNFAVSVRCIKD